MHHLPHVPTVIDYLECHLVISISNCFVLSYPCKRSQEGCLRGQGPENQGQETQKKKGELYYSRLQGVEEDPPLESPAKP